MFYFSKMNAGNFFRAGAGRFARARGSSVFARAFNGELPRHFVSFPVSFPVSFSRLGELPLSGFAEQPLAGVLNAMRLSQDVSDLEAPVESSEDAVLAASGVMDAIELISCLREWSGSTIQKEAQGQP